MAVINQPQREPFLNMKKNRISSTPHTIAKSEHLLQEVLVRLPPISLLAFKWVSKQWLSIISSPRFITDHIQRQGTAAPSGLLLQKDDHFDTTEFEYLPFTAAASYGPPHLTYLKQGDDPFHIPVSEFKSRQIKIIQSCNGLLLCSFRNTTCANFQVRYIVCNPTTRQFQTIPSPNVANSGTLSVSLAFDPSHSPHFKVVCLVSFELSTYELLTYESQSNKWDTSPIEFVTTEDTNFDCPVFFRRAIHWYTHDQLAPYFDVDKKCVKLILMPELTEHDCVTYFGESRSHLHLIKNSASNTGAVFSVFELQEDYSDWSIRYIVNLDTLRVRLNEECGINPNIFLRFQPSVMSIVRREREEESDMILFVYGTVVSYNFNDQSFKKLSSLDPIHEAFKDGWNVKYDWQNVYPFIQTLCPI